jgi:uncharacterized membrane protein YbhN (UPF0104 family)
MAPLKENNRLQSIRWKLVITVALLGATIWISATILDLTAVVTSMAALPKQTALVILLLGAVSWLLRGLRTWILLDQLPLTEALGLSFVHNTANNLAPMRLGELALPILGRWLGNVEFSIGLTSLLWIRLLDFVSLVGISLCIILLPAAGTVVLALLAALIFLTPMVLGFIVPKTEHIQLPKILAKARAQLIYEAQNGKRLHQMWRLTVLAWLSKIIGMGMLLATLTDIPMTKVATTILGAELSSILPIHGLAGAGSYEAGGILGSAVIGLSPVVALEMTIQLHIYVLSLTAVFGILGTLLLMKRIING